jgi:hypothetical protein
MSWILVAAVLTGGPELAVVRVTPQEAYYRLADDVETGMLIVCQGDCLAIKIYSASPYTHVAAVVVSEPETFVYDSTCGAGVRKQSLRDFVRSQSDHTLHVFRPRRPFGPQRAARFEQYLESQLGRPYAIHHHLTGERAAGLHCSEYVTDALISAELLRAKQPPRVSPASLVEGIVKADLYDEVATLDLVLKPAPRPESLSWCARMWFDTKECTRACYCKLQGWFCCK